ncbi:MAG: acyl-CoA dehydratase activase-related protein, partial [Deltaproteobacteria bacterium]|nr:acyl-CoA dehydratase activase-related protein [Deltaproteobacteria bacterium]
QAGAPDNAACPYAQTLAYTAPSALNITRPLLLTGPVFFGEGPKPLIKSLVDLAAKINIPAPEVKRAMELALEGQKAFQARLKEKGQDILSNLRPKDMAMIVVARPYNGFDPGLNLRLNQKLRDLGILGMPMDFLPLDIKHDEPLSHYWRYGQKITAVATAIANDERLEGLYISNFGCGPDSFILHFFKHVMGRKPFLEIEIDEHSSDVGAVTRLEAFLDSLAARKARDAAGGKKGLNFHPLRPIKCIRGPKPHQTIYIPPMCDHTKTMAAAFRAAGISAEALPESDQTTVELGRAQTSGKECYPLILCVGDFIKLTQRPGFDPAHSVLFMPSSNGPCRFGQYGRYISLITRRLGFDNLEVLSIDQTGGMYEALNQAGSTKSGAKLTKAIWRALITVDMLQKALFHTRPRETTPGAADQAYREALAELENIIENDNLKAMGSFQAQSRERFQAIRLKDVNTKPRVGLVGEIYVRHNRFANEDVIRRLEALGAEIETPPLTEWIFYVSHVNSMRANRQGQWRKRLVTILTDLVQNHELNKIARSWKGFFPHGTTEPPIDSTVALGERFLHRSFQGEAILSLGKGLEFYHRGAKGLVNIMPFTCMPGMVVGALTGHLREEASGMPAINLAYDGQSQTNTQARLEAFMYQVNNFNHPKSQ